MKKGILGITDLQITYGTGDATRISMELIASPGYEASHLLKESWDQMFPGNVIVKCSHCLQWGAVKTVCKHCGTPID